MHADADYIRYHNVNKHYNVLYTIDLLLG